MKTSQPLFPIFLLGGVAGSIVATVGMTLTGFGPDGLREFVDKNPSVAATVLAALLGFLGVMLTTFLGFQNLIRSNDHKAQNDENARQREIAHDRRVLVAALQAELTALTNQVEIAIEQHKGAAALYKKEATTFGDKISFAFIPPTFQTPIYDSHIEKLGLLGPDLGGKIVNAYASTRFSHDPNVKFTAEQASQIYTMAATRLDLSLKRIGWTIGALEAASGGIEGKGEIRG